jgi:hypothetical protein
MGGGGKFVSRTSDNGSPAAEQRRPTHIARQGGRGIGGGGVAYAQEKGRKVEGAQLARLKENEADAVPVPYDWRRGRGERDVSEADSRRVCGCRVCVVCEQKGRQHQATRDKVAGAPRFSMFLV